MLDFLGVTESLRFFVYLMLSFAFFSGILLVVSQEAFECFSKELMKEYGITKRILPKMEAEATSLFDWLVLKFRLVSGLLISTIAFILLLLSKSGRI